MLEVYSTNLAVANGENIVFDGKYLQTGITATVDGTGTTVTLSRPGIYRVDFNATGSSTASGTIGAQLYANGTAVPRALSTANTDAGEQQAISFSTLVAVNPAVISNTANITVQYTGSAGTLNLANMIVCKIA